ncbi:phospholipase D-like domain-containing protein [Nitrosovibrio tenuis]|uniref:phospholipase D-like domain-containing protein n=1 Tax=Nitrosovibrio tenuis TaxID=1233 RepID=UPI001FE0BDE2
MPGKTDSNLVFYASRSYYDELLSAGVKIYERQDALLHAKTAIIDGVWSTIGSTNLDWLSIEHNQEINAVILGQDFGSQMKSMFEKDIGDSRLVTLDAWRKRSIGPRIKEFAADYFPGGLTGENTLSDGPNGASLCLPFSQPVDT